MWLLANKTRFSAERTWVRDTRGAEIWIVAVRAVFDIHPDGSVEPSKEQQDVVRVAEFEGDPVSTRLIYDSDLVRTKVATDVVLHGHAHVPNGRAATTLTVRLTVGSLQKTLVVHGDRVWERGAFGVAPSDPQPFTRMPVRYERAFGGARERAPGSTEPPAWEPRNPIGVGCGRHASELVGTPVPNLEYPGDPVVSGQHTGSPACFAPVPQSWSPRRELAGTYDDVWLEQRQPLLPLDFDDRHYQCAPGDQQVEGFLRGGEHVELVNLSPSHPLLRFQLPHLILGFTTYFSDGEVRHHRANLHSVILEPNHPRVAMVWHSAVPCHPKVLKLEETVVRVKEWRGPTAARVALAG